jgi:2,5-diamino-6-(ribosylamino)-4(3H)-pyrimidinone 5'-phosphate reductase
MAASQPSAELRPAVWVNCAVSVDGRLAYAHGRRAALSGPEDLARVQRLRADSDGIVVGVGTVILDDPSLRVHWEMIDEPPRPPPLRIVLDSLGRTPGSARVLDGALPTLVAVSERSTRKFPDGIDTVVAGEEIVDIPLLWTLLYARGLRRLMVEGGSRVLASVLRGGWFDRLTVYVAPVLIGGSTAPPLMTGPECPGPEQSVGLTLLALERLGDGHLLSYAPRRDPPMVGTNTAPPHRYLTFTLPDLEAA